MAKIAQIKSAHLQPEHHILVSQLQHSPNMPDTADTSDSDTDTPFLLEADVSSFRDSVIGWLTTDASQLPFSSLGCLLIYEWISWETETLFGGCALMGEISVNFFIHCLPEWCINWDACANRWIKIDGDRDRWCLFKIPDINIHLSIYWSIDRYINGSKNGGRETSLGKQPVGHIEKTDRKDAPTGRTVAIIDRTKYQKS